MLPHPWMQFYTRDWLDNKELRRCSPAARAVLLDLMCLAHEGVPYGHLADKIGPLTDDYMASRCVISTERFREALSELQSYQRVSTEDNRLVIPRMVEDGAERLRRSEAGGKGGNPKLVKDAVNQEVNQSVNDGDKHARAQRASVSVSVSDSLSSQKKKEETPSSTLFEDENAETPFDHPRVVRPDVPSQENRWFAQWWAIYWLHKARAAAEKAFRAKVKTEPRFQRVMAATREQTPEMLSREPSKRPYGATWLNGERWEDEPSASPVNGTPPPGARPSSTDAVRALALRNLERTGQLL